ncbi:MAG TPA: hypothetical protein PLJ66_01805 [Methanofastidiosum sp.]|nr:hypothetical protein [Methanofastidiosum sp.]
MRNMKMIMTVLLLFALLLPSVYAVQNINGEDGKVVTIDNDVNEDLFVSGDQVTINGNINGDLFAVAGEVVINGQVFGDAYIAGGNVTVNGQVTKGLVVGAGQATISGNTEKILAACGNLDVKGDTNKIVAAAGNVKIYPEVIVEDYAYIATGSFDNQGTIKGEVILTADQLVNKGSVEGPFEFQDTEFEKDFTEGIKALVTIFSILATLGMLMLGILFIRFFPKLFFAIEKEIEKDTIVRTIVGFLLIIGAIIGLIILAVTIIGLPIALVLGMFFIIALVASTLFVSYCTGNFVANRLNFKTSEMGIFILGFVILAILQAIPVIGSLVGLVVTSLGFGAIFYTIKNNWNQITAKN